MTITAIQYRMNAGVPGDITRSHSSTVEPQAVDATNPPQAYGQMVVMDATSLAFRHPLSTDTAPLIADIGFNVRPYPITGNGNDGLGVAVPNSSIPMNVMKRGYMNVAVEHGTAAKGNPVYCRIADNDSTGRPIGGIEASSDVTASGAAHAGNTGNAAISAVSAQANAQAGVYNAKVIAAGTNAATIALYDPNGKLIDEQEYSGSGAALSFANDQVHATITDGSTDLALGDSYQITVVFNTVKVPGNTYFMGGQDASGNAEIAFNI